MVAASFSSADSALTSITTSVFVDLLGLKKTENRNYKYKRIMTHTIVCMLFFVIVLAFDFIKQKSVLEFIYTIVGYLYGPLIGLYTFGLFFNRKLNEKVVPFLAILSPIVCYVLNLFCYKTFFYTLGYELLMINGLITFVGLFVAFLTLEFWLIS